MLTIILQALVEGILNAGILSLVAIGLTLIFGVMKIVNFAHGDFLMLGLYASYWITVSFGVHPYYSAIFIVPLLFVTGLLFYKYFIKKVEMAPESSQILLTFGISLVLQNLILIFFSADFLSVTMLYQDTAYQFGPVTLRFTRISGFVIGVGMSLLVYVLLKNTELGRMIRAASQDPNAAQLVGIHVERVLLVSSGIGLSLLGVAAAWLMPFTFITPTIGMSYLLPVFIIVILGGLGSVRGALLGALVYGVSSTLGSALIPGSLGLVLPLIIFVLVLLLKPAGLFRGAI